MRRHSPKLRHRPSRVVPASITAVTLVAVGGSSGVVAVWKLVTGSWPTPAQTVGDFLTATAWMSPTWLAMCIGVAVLGLLMIIAAVKPGRLNAARLAPAGQDGTEVPTELVISRRAIARLAASRAEQIDGVDSVRVRAADKHVRLTIGTTSDHRPEIAQAVTEVVRRGISEAGVSPVPRVTTRAWTKAI